MEQLLQHYRSLQGQLLVGNSQQSLLPDLKPAKLTREPAVTTESMEGVRDWLSSHLSNETVSGWVTLKSQTVLVDSVDKLIAAVADEYLISAELAAGEDYFRVYFENGNWVLCKQTLAYAEDGDILGQQRHYAIDGLRFPEFETQTINYMVLWTLTEDGPKAVAQHLTGIKKQGANNE